MATSEQIEERILEWLDELSHTEGYAIAAEAHIRILREERDAALARAERAEALLRRVSAGIDALEETDICTYYGEFSYELDREIKSALAAIGDGHE